MNRTILLITTLLISPLHATPSPWLKAETANMHMITGPFVQRDYGFSVEPPAEASKYVTNGGNADHGVRMILGEHRKIDIYPEYTEDDLGNTKLCQRNQFPAEQGITRVVAAPLGTQTACLLTISSRKTVMAVIQAAGSDRGQGIMYSLLLTTTPEASHKDLASLHKVAASFKRIPIVP